MTSHTACIGVAGSLIDEQNTRAVPAPWVYVFTISVRLVNGSLCVRRSVGIGKNSSRLSRVQTHIDYRALVYVEASLIRSCDGPPNARVKPRRAPTRERRGAHRMRSSRGFS